SLWQSGDEENLRGGKQTPTMAGRGGGGCRSASLRRRHTEGGGGRNPTKRQHENRDLGSCQRDREGDSSRSNGNGSGTLGSLHGRWTQVRTLRSDKLRYRGHRNSPPVQRRILSPREKTRCAWGNPCFTGS